MAASNDVISVDKLERLLQCSICLDTLKDPRTLSCLHSYCKDCLDKYVKNHKRKKAGVHKNLACPICRTKFTLNPITEVPRNHFICNMLDVMSVQNRTKSVPCSHCKQPSVGRCITCELFMCKKCFQPHNSYPGFHDHTVLSMEELSKPENKAKIKGRSHCKKHDLKKIKFYCETCDETICRRCMDFDHLRPDHECLALESVAEEKLEALKISNSILERKLSEGNEVLKELTDAAQALEDNFKQARSKINQRKCEILTTVERNAKCLINEAEEIFRSKHSAVVEEMEQIQTYVNKVKVSADLSSTLIADGNDEEIVLAQKAVQENTENIQSEYPEYVKNSHDDEILLYDDERVDALLMEDVGEKVGNTQGKISLSIYLIISQERILKR